MANGHGAFRRSGHFPKTELFPRLGTPMCEPGRFSIRRSARLPCTEKFLALLQRVWAD